METTAMVEKSSIAATQIGGLMAVIGGLTLTQWLAIGGFMLAVVSFLFQAWITWFYKEKHYRLALMRAEHELRHHVSVADDDQEP